MKIGQGARWALIRMQCLLMMMMMIDDGAEGEGGRETGRHGCCCHCDSAGNKRKTVRKDSCRHFHPEKQQVKKQRRIIMHGISV